MTKWDTSAAAGLTCVSQLPKPELVPQEEMLKMSPRDAYATGKNNEMRQEQYQQTAEVIEANGRMLAEKHKIENWSEKRLVQTSPVYPSRFEALDACVGINALDECEYAYVTEDSRVVGIYRYYDVTPNEPVGKGQRRVIIPKRDQMLARQVAATAERAGISWSTGDDLAKALERISVAHPGAIFNARTTTSVEDGEPIKHFNLSITLKGK